MGGLSVLLACSFEVLEAAQRPRTESFMLFGSAAQLPKPRSSLIPEAAQRLKNLRFLGVLEAAQRPGTERFLLFGSAAQRPKPKFCGFGGRAAAGLYWFRSARKGGKPGNSYSFRVEEL